MNALVTGLAALVLMVQPGLALANTWCSINWPGVIFCDDFDRYCTDPPPYPQECTCCGDFNELRRVWTWTNVVCSNMTIDDGFVASEPFAGRTPCQDNGLITHHGVNLTPYIQSWFGASEYLAVMGNDQYPLVVEWALHEKNNGTAQYNNAFMEVAYGSLAQAATDYALSANCSACGGASDTYPMVCQQETPPAGCPPLATAPHVSSIAAGSLAYLDNDPCHCAGSVHSPNNPRLSYFDGYKWYKLRSGLFPGGGSGGGGDFIMQNGINQIRLIITTSNVKIELTCVSSGQYSWCDAPRDYAGPFNHLFAGYRVPCRLKADTWECRTGPACIKGAPLGGVPTFDNVVFRGGQGYTSLGACCLPNATCEMTYGPYYCTPRGGTYNGGGVDCPSVPCCPPFRPDHDLDNDVDSSDFGWFQRCLPETGSTAPPSVPCFCADLNNDNRITPADFDIFIRCLTGADVPAVPNCLN